MLDGNTERLPDTLEHELARDALRPLNPAAWLQELDALEAEFATILNQPASWSAPGAANPR